MANRSLITDRSGVSYGTQQSHPFSAPHEKNPSWLGRKALALNAQAGVSSRDVHLPASHGSMPWAPLAVWRPDYDSSEIQSHLLPTHIDALNREVVSQRDTTLWLAPDHSKYPIVNFGDLGASYAQSAFFLEDKQQ